MNSPQTRLTQLAHHSRNIIIRLNANLHVTAFNPSAEQYLHCQQQTVLGQSFPKLCQEHAIDIPLLSQLTQLTPDQTHRCIGRCYYHTLTWSISRTNTSTPWLLTAKPIPSSDPGLPQIIDQLPVHIYWLNRQGRYMGCSHLFATSAGFSRASALINKTLFDIGKHLNWCEKQTLQLWQKDLAAMTAQSDHQSEETITWQSGATQTFRIKRTPLFDQQEICIGLLSIATNITPYKNLQTELKAAQTILIQQEQDSTLQLQTILNNLPGNIFWMDRQGVYLGCNQAQATKLGFEQTSDLAGKTIFDIAKHLNWPAKTAPAVYKNDQEIMVSKQTQDFEEIAAWETDNPRVHGAKKTPILDDKGNCIGIIGIAQDITEEKAMAAALQEATDKATHTDRVKSDFIANMSHDIRTPLSGIIGMSEIISNETQEKDTQTHAKQITHSAHQLLRLLNEILELSKLNHTTAQQQKISFSLPTLLANLEALFHPVIQQKGLQFITDYNDHLPEFLLGYPTLLHRVIANLLNNAIKFTDTGYINLQANTKTNSATNQQELLITIEDSGIGIPADKLASIFDPFTRLTPSYSSRYSGTGLGLYISQQFADTMHGTLTVSSTLNKGSSFTCTLPIETPPPQAVDHTQTQSHSANTSANQICRVLLVEDDLLAQKITITSNDSSQ